jgi:hypothetical protein
MEALYFFKSSGLPKSYLWGRDFFADLVFDYLAFKFADRNPKGYLAFKFADTTSYHY